ncbi:MAG TPA: TrkA family potassium uptake protein [bacterium]|nr:TrkA family potassium uptake protein [bacterium]HOL47982.1 TrkA family potassium uptake protein [bacterium]HPQ19206.1 TrkA family potassium uptake protein [bacterium]
MKQIVVIGLGDFGFNLAVKLSEFGEQVIAIDKNRDLIQEIKDKVELAICADAREKETILKIIDKEIDIVVIAVGNDLETSILTTLYLKESGIKEIYVKSNNNDHSKILKLIGATKIIFPENEIAIKLATQLSNPNFIDYLPLMKGYSIVEIKAPKEFQNKSISELKLRSTYYINIIAIKNINTNQINMFPSADYVIKNSDNLIIAGKDNDIIRVQKLD